MATKRQIGAEVFKKNLTSPYNNGASSVKRMIDVPKETTTAQATPLSQPVAQDWATIFRQQAEANRANPLIANQYTGVANAYDTNFMNTANAIGGLYNNFQQNMQPANQQYLDINAQVNQEVLKRLQDQLNTINAQYGPGGELRTKADQYYGDLYKSIAQQGGLRQAQIASDAVAGGFGGGAARAAQAVAQNDTQKTFLDAKKQEVTDLQNLYKTYDDYLANLLQVYGNTQDKYVIGVINKLREERNILGSNLLQQQQNLAMTEYNAYRGIQAEDRNLAQNKDLAQFQFNLQKGALGGGGGATAGGTTSNTTQQTTADVTKDIVQGTQYTSPDGRSQVFRLRDGRGVYFQGGYGSKPVYVTLPK